MNDHELDQALAGIGARRTAVMAPAGLRTRVRGVPQAAPARRSWWPSIGAARIGSRFGTMPAALASAVVLLVAGVVLTGTLLTKPVPDQIPGATMSELMPGVDLEMDEIRPGVHQILSDGVRALDRNVFDVAVTPGGDIWVSKARAQGNGSLVDNRIIRLGDPAASLRGDPHGLNIDVDFDGLLVASRPFAYVRLEGTEWVPLEGVSRVLADFPRCVSGFKGQSLFRGGVAADGSCWAAGPSGAPVRSYEDQTTAQEYLAASDVGLDLEGTLMGVAVDGAGAFWTARLVPDTGFAGLVAFDGQEWSSIPYEGPGASPLSHEVVADIVPSDEGTVHVVLGGDEDRPGHEVVTWDGRSWARFGPIGSRSLRWSGTQRLPDGRFLFDSSAVFDGSTLTLFDPLGLGPDAPYGSVDIAPDGTLLVIVADRRGVGGLYAISPEALARDG